MRFNILRIAFIPFILCFYEGKASFSRLTAKSTKKIHGHFFLGPFHPRTDGWMRILVVAFLPLRTS